MMKSEIQFAKGFFTAKVLKIGVVNVIGGLLMGYIIGFVGVYNTLIELNDNCTRYESDLACGSLKHTNCVWSAANNTCMFGDFNCDAFGVDEGACGEHSMCAFDYDSGVCHHRVGFGAVNKGIFVGAMTVGGMVGGSIGGMVIKRIGLKSTLVLSGAISIFASLLIHLSRGFDVYAILVISRAVFGVSGGFLCVAAPMYIEEMAPETYRPTLGVFFQIFVTFGIFLVALMGLIVEPPQEHPQGAKQRGPHSDGHGG